MSGRARSRRFSVLRTVRTRPSVLQVRTCASPWRAVMASRQEGEVISDAICYWLPARMSSRVCRGGSSQAGVRIREGYPHLQDVVPPVLVRFSLRAGTNQSVMLPRHHNV